MKNSQLMSGWSIIILLVVAFLLRLGMIFVWTSRFEGPFFFGDSDSYWQLGRTIAEGKPYQYYGMQIMRTPGYPVLLAPLFWLFGDNPPVFLARLECCLFGTITVALVGVLAMQLFRNKAVALLSAGIVALDPGQILTSVLVLSEAPFCMFMLLQLICWNAALDHGVSETFEKSRFQHNERPITWKHWTWTVLAGIITAVTVYCRPSWFHFVPFAVAMRLLLVAVRTKTKGTERIINAPIPREIPDPVSVKIEKRTRSRLGVELAQHAVLLLVFLAAMIPWGLRNARISGHYIMTSLQMGASLYDGLNPTATGASDMRFVDTFREWEKNSPSMNPETETFEFRLDHRMKKASIDWAWSHPGKVLELAGVKFVRLWNFWPNEPSFRSVPIRLAVLCSYVPVIGLAMGGIVLTFRRGFTCWLLWIPAVYITALHLIFVSSLRYRLPAMLCLSILAAYCLVFLCVTNAKGRE